MKWFKRILVCLLLLIMAIGIFVGVEVHRYHGRPPWYPKILTPEASREAARRAFQKFGDVQRWAANAQASENDGANPDHVSQRPRSASVAPETISLTQDELNGFFDQWRSEGNWSKKMDKYVTDPVIVLQKDRIILGGTDNELGSFISAHFDPRLQDGKLSLHLIDVMGGNASLPAFVYSSQKDKLERSMRSRLATLQAKAKIAPNGSSNKDAITASTIEMLLNALNDRTSPAVFFLPYDIEHPHEGFPVRITQLSVTDGNIAMTVVPLTKSERADLLDEIKKPFTPESADDTATADDNNSDNP